MNAFELKAVIEDYVDIVASAVQSSNAALRSAESSTAACSSLNSCSCTSCREMPGTAWVAESGSSDPVEVDLSAVALTYPKPGISARDPEAKIGQCLAESLEHDFLRIVRAEYSDVNRAGYIYYGSQNDGMYFQWPAMQYCPGSWDPRYRPWYVNVVTGPKDVVIVLDISGSMSTNPAAKRNIKAIDAMERLMLTFTERDYVGLVLFNDRALVPAEQCPGMSSAGARWCVEWDPLKATIQPYPDGIPVLLPMSDGSVVLDKDGKMILTDDNKKAYVDAARSKLDPSRGGTNFYAGLKAAFDMLESSLIPTGNTVTSSCQICSGGCNQMVLFMTDGLDESGRPDLLDDIETMQNGLKSKRPNNQMIPIYTYTFGSDAIDNMADLELSQIPTKIACRNIGIAYHIEDGADLGSMMTDYYKYFIWGLTVQNAVDMKPKWISYTDGWGGEPLLAGCKAVFDDEQLQNDNVELLGVACMDMNIIVELMGTPNSFQNRALYENFYQAMEDDMGSCLDIQHSFGDMLKLQKESKGGKVCESCDMKKINCKDPPCFCNAVLPPAPTPPAGTTASWARVFPLVVPVFVAALG
jgi:hypothetical protein